MAGYPFAEIERKWQDYWERNRTFRVREDPAVPPEKRRYVLDMFPYPSSAGLHVGHPLGYTATDIYCRYLRMNGYAVLHPMGFDSFGLPAENYAIQTGTHPRLTTEANIKHFRAQIKSLGFSYDWEREVSTHTPEYYRWTQWIFLKLYERGLAYVDEAPVWYCEALGTVLANEEVLATADGPRSERGNHPVERRPLTQWMLRITAYADRLLNDLDKLDWPESIKTMQRNWIGRSEGATVQFALADAPDRANRTSSDYIEVFTTRPDTLFGATYMVLAPEHKLTARIASADQRSVVQAYIEQARAKSDLERTDLARDKSGVFSGAWAINPVNNRRIPIWIADYVLVSYGTGAIMAVPAHDERDYEFATRYKLPIEEVCTPTKAHTHFGLPYTAPGVAIHSGQFSGLPTTECIAAICDWLTEQQLGRRTVTYKLRDWIFSRQRYWGEPIPLVHGADGQVVPLPAEALPLKLPELKRYRPTGDGESPLAAVESWVHTTLPGSKGGPGRRETNTMPQWAGSCWYYLRFLDPHNDNEPASRAKIDYWMPVDLYVGGAEHAVLHLLYARFWHKVLYDIGMVNSDEPFRRLVNQGMILGEDGAKMSKSLGNVINPDEIIGEWGADSMRVYEMFMGPLQMQKPWATSGLAGIHRFLSRVWRLTNRPISDEQPPEELLRLLHRTIRKVGDDTKQLAFNTAIAQMMIFVNACYKQPTLYRALWQPFVLLLSPYAPHIGEELWQKLGNTPSLAHAEWPRWDAAYLEEKRVTIVIQIDGKLRARIEQPIDTPQATLIEAAHAHERIATLLKGRRVLRTIAVPNRLVNVVTTPIEQ